jgi:long-chain acyl-CoA synthetase
MDMPNRDSSNRPNASLRAALSRADAARRGAASLNTLVDLIDRWRNDSQPAVITDRDGEPESTSYGWLADRATRIAGGLRAKGTKHAETIAILAPNSPAWIAAYFGVIAAGATAVPLDYHSAAADLAGMLARCRCRQLFTVEAALDRLPQAWRDGASAIYIIDECDRADGSTTSWTILLHEKWDGPAAKIEPEAVASLLFTSGTTGTPKAVPLTHKQFLSNVNALLMARVVHRGERVLLPLPLHHTYPFTVGMLTTLTIGAVLVLPSGATGPQILHAAHGTRVSALVGVPGLYVAMANAIGTRISRRGCLVRFAFDRLLSLSVWLCRKFSLRIGRWLFAPLHRQFGGKLRVLSAGGAKLDAEIAWKLEGLGWRVLSGYGLTETAPILTFNAPHNARIGSEGLPIAGVELRVAPVEGSTFGEILARGPSVFSGYLDDPAANATAFAESGWFRTGDLGFVDQDGYLHILGRANETLVLPGGKKVFPEDIEKLFAHIPFIKEIAILQHQQTLVGLVVPNPDAIRMRGATRIEALLREEIERILVTLRPYERMSGYVITMQPLPRTHLGKLKRHLLPGIYAEAKAGKRERPAVELSSVDRALIARPDAKPIWDWLVARYPDQPLTPDTSPQLDLGVDSLQWIELTLELQERFGIRINEAAIGRILSLRDLLNEAAQQHAPPEHAPPASEPPGQAPNVALWLRPVGIGHLLLGALLHGMNKLLTPLLFRLQVIGKEHLPATEKIVLTPNHVSYLDPVVLAAGFSWRGLRRTAWVGWSGIMQTGCFMRAVSRAATVLPIDPDRDPGAVLDLVDSALKMKDRLVWFPEGRRSPTGEITEFLPGIALVLERTGAKAMPVHISGTFEALPLSRAIPRLHKVTICFGKPLSADELEARGEGPNRHVRIARALQNEVVALGELDRSAQA